MSAAYREKNGVSSIGFRGCVVAGAALMTGAVFPFLERQAMRDYDTALGFPAPERGETRTMPAKNGLRLNDLRRTEQARPEPGHPD